MMNKVNNQINQIFTFRPFDSRYCICMSFSVFFCRSSWHHISKSFDFDLGLLFCLSIIVSLSLSTLTCFLMYCLLVATSVSLLALICFLLYRLSIIAFVSLSALTCFLPYRLSVTISVTLSALTCFLSYRLLVTASVSLFDFNLLLLYHSQYHLSVLYHLLCYF